MDSINRIVHDVFLGTSQRMATRNRLNQLTCLKGPVAGKFVDDFGPRWPILMGSFLHIFGLMMVSISDKYYQIFLAQGVCSAIGCSFLFYPSEYSTYAQDGLSLTSNSNRCMWHLVQETSRPCIWYHGGRLEHWWCCASNNGSTTSSSDRIWMDYENLSVLTPRTSHIR